MPPSRPAGLDFQTDTTWSSTYGRAKSSSSRPVSPLAFHFQKCNFRISSRWLSSMRSYRDFSCTVGIYQIAPPPEQICAAFPRGNTSCYFKFYIYDSICSPLQCECRLHLLSRKRKKNKTKKRHDKALKWAKQRRPYFKFQQSLKTEAQLKRLILWKPRRAKIRGEARRRKEPKCYYCIIKAPPASPSPSVNKYDFNPGISWTQLNYSPLCEVVLLHICTQEGGCDSHSSGRLRMNYN